MHLHVNDQFKLVKSRQYANLATGVHAMPFNPRLAWQYVKLITKRETAHHNVAVNMAMKTEDGSLAKNPEENLEIIHPHSGLIIRNT